MYRAKHSLSERHVLAQPYWIAAAQHRPPKRNPVGKVMVEFNLCGLRTNLLSHDSIGHIVKQKERPLHWNYLRRKPTSPTRMRASPSSDSISSGYSLLALGGPSPTSCQGDHRVKEKLKCLTTSTGPGWMSIPAWGRSMRLCRVRQLLPAHQPPLRH